MTLLLYFVHHPSCVYIIVILTIAVSEGIEAEPSTLTEQQTSIDQSRGTDYNNLLESVVYITLNLLICIGSLSPLMCGFTQM